MPNDLHKVGMEIRRKAFGDEYVDRALESVDEFNDAVGDGVVLPLAP